MNTIPISMVGMTKNRVCHFYFYLKLNLLSEMIIYILKFMASFITFF